MFTTVFASLMAIILPIHQTSASPTVNVEAGSSWVLVVNPNTNHARSVRSFADKTSCDRTVVGMAINHPNLTAECFAR